MKVVVIDKPNSIKTVDVSIPEIAPDEVLVKVSYCGICGTDFDIYKGLSNFSNNIQYPVRIGHEWSGIVDKVGTNVNGLKPGDRVIGDGKVTCGKCESCRLGRWGRCENIRAVGTVGDNWDGAFAEYIIMPERNIFQLPNKISLKEAAVMEPAAIALNALVSANLSNETTVLVLGTGSIGLSAVGLAKALGAPQIFLSGRRDFKLNIGKQMGADVVINSTKQDLDSIINKKTNGKKADIVVETSGNMEAVYGSINNVGRMGVISLVGFYEDTLKELDVNSFVLNKVSFLGASGTNECFPVLINLMENKKISLLPLITKIYEFNQIEEAMDSFKHRDDKRIKVLVRIHEEK